MKSEKELSKQYQKKSDKQHVLDNTNLELTKRFTPFLYLINCGRNIFSEIFSLIV